MRAVIFANGIIKHLPEPGNVIMPEDLLIAADGGARYFQAIGITPAVVIGDFDSLGSDELNKLQSSGVEIIQYPARKDQTDLELALRLAVDRGADEIVVFGALGARWDMSIANILLPAEQNLSSTTIRIIDGCHEIMLLHAGKEITFRGKKGIASR